MSTRTGLIAAILLAAALVVGATVLIGPRVLSVVGAAMFGLFVVELVARRRRRSTPGDAPGTRARRLGEPFEWRYSLGSAEPAALRRATDLLVERHGFDSRRTEELDSGRAASLSAGSQLRTRLFGGSFVAARHLPVWVTLRRDRTSGEIEMDVQDALGVAVRSKALQRAYDELAVSLKDTVEQGLASPRARV